jgi:hypothetical protein
MPMPTTREAAILLTHNLQGNTMIIEIIPTLLAALGLSLVVLDGFIGGHRNPKISLLVSIFSILVAIAYGAAFFILFIVGDGICMVLWIIISIIEFTTYRLFWADNRSVQH